MKNALLTLVILAIVGCTAAPSPAPAPSPEPEPSTTAAPAADPNAFRANAPDPLPESSWKLPAVTRTTLPNGLRLLTAENHGSPLVAVRLLVRTGAASDPSDHAGLASMTADMLDEGAGRLTAIEIAERISSLGIEASAESGFDGTIIAMDVLSRNLAEALDVLSVMVRDPRFDAKELERVRKERLATILQQRQNATIVANERFGEAVFGEAGYGRPASGTEEGVRKISRNDLLTFYRRHYLPNNVSLIVTGDIDPNATRALVEQKLRDWKSGEIAPRQPVEPRGVSGSKIVIVDRPQSVQSEIRVGHVGVPFGGEDFFAINVMNTILGGTSSSRVYANLRTTHGYTYGARSAFVFRRDPGLFLVSTPVRNEVTLPAVQEILNELRRMRSGDITDEEIGRVREYLAGLFPQQVESASDLAARLLELEMFGLPENFFDDYRQRLMAVTKEDVVRVANRYVRPDETSIVVVGKASEIRTPLETIGRDVEVVAIGKQ
jgi:zinc protease